MSRWDGAHDHAPEFIRELPYGQGSYLEALPIYERELHVLKDEGKRRINKRKCKKVQVEGRSYREQMYGLDAQ